MISPELIRRFPFFSGFTQDQIVTLTKYADELHVDKNHYLLKEGDELNNFFIIVNGEVHIVLNLPKKDREVIISTLAAGDLFGWSALVPPYFSTAGAKAVIPTDVISFNARELLRIFEKDCEFGFLMMQKVAQVIRDRLNAIRIETLAYQAS